MVKVIIGTDRESTVSKNVVTKELVDQDNEVELEMY